MVEVSVKHKTALEVENESLREEVERLKADNVKNAEAFEELSSGYLERADAAASRLATATELLEMARDAIDEACWPVWWEKWRAFLAAQPAAPARTEADELESTEHRPACRYEKEFPSLDAQDCPNCSRPPTFIGVDCSSDAPKELREFARRTEAEQRVLDAMADASIGSLEHQIAVHPGSALSDACREELARRQR